MCQYGKSVGVYICMYERERFGDGIHSPFFEPKEQNYTRESMCAPVSDPTPGSCSSAKCSINIPVLSQFF